MRDVLARCVGYLGSANSVDWWLETRVWKARMRDTVDINRNKTLRLATPNGYHHRVISIGHQIPQSIPSTWRKPFKLHDTLEDLNGLSFLERSSQNAVICSD
jgi:hypothetical protein